MLENNLKINFRFNINIWVIFLLFVFFPYTVFFYPIPSDLQPTALIFALLVILLNNQSKISKDSVILFIPIFASLLFTISDFNLNSIRSFTGYFSFAILTFLLSRVKITNNLKPILLKRIIFVWFIVGFIQTFFYKKFLSFLLYSYRTTESRGSVSLAPEPSYYGFLCLFLLLIVFSKRKYNNRLSVNLLIIQILLFSRSTIAVLYLFILLLLRNFFNIKSIFKKYFILIIICGVIFFLKNFERIDTNQRLIYLLQEIIRNPISLVTIDGSINDRIFHIFFSIRGAIKNFLIPHGFASWDNYVIESVLNNKYAWNVSQGRIMSTYGAALFELGFFGFPIIFYINKIIILSSMFKSDKIVFFIFINGLLLTAIPMAFPILALLLKIISEKEG